MGFYQNCTCIDIVQIWFGTANGQSSTMRDRVICLLPSVFSGFFFDENLSKSQGIFTKIGIWIDIIDIWFVIANRQIS